MDEHKLWEPVKFPHEWIKEDTSRIDDIAPSWFKRQQVLQGSAEYDEFLAKLKREHAVETGIIERLYDLKRSASHMLVERGFFESHVNYSDSDIATSQLMSHLRDQLNGINYVFDAVAVNRGISINFIKDVHTLVTKNQRNTKGLDQFGNIIEVPMEKG
ncbi:MAG: hypothetical protein LBV04_06610, partial [Deferribacteraceae bacterium]|nr:hypothetical protein [Deferribacteraceae bacterium]